MEWCLISKDENDGIMCDMVALDDPDLQISLDDGVVHHVYCAFHDHWIHCFRNGSVIDCNFDVETCESCQIGGRRHKYEEA